MCFSFWDVTWNPFPAHEQRLLYTCAYIAYILIWMNRSVVSTRYERKSEKMAAMFYIKNESTRDRNGITVPQSVEKPGLPI